MTQLNTHQYSPSTLLHPNPHRRALVELEAELGWASFRVFRENTLQLAFGQLVSCC